MLNETRQPRPKGTRQGHGQERRAKLFRLRLNQSQTTAADVYLLLYPKPALSRALANASELGRHVSEFLDEIAPLLDEGRVCGGSLYKMKPKKRASVIADANAAMLPPDENRPLLHTELSNKRTIEQAVL